MDNLQLEQITKRLDNISKKIDMTNEVMKEGLKPEPATKRILDIVASIAGIISAITIVDIIRAWLGG